MKKVARPSSDPAVLGKQIVDLATGNQPDKKAKIKFAKKKKETVNKKS